jgi:hypothetical protein
MCFISRGQLDDVGGKGKCSRLLGEERYGEERNEETAVLFIVIVLKRGKESD